MAYCDDVNDVLVDEAGRIGQMIPSKIITGSPWIRLIEQAEFPEAMGYEINTLVYQRTTIPNVGSSAWADMTTNDGTGNSCNPPPQNINYAQTLRSYNLQQAAVRSPSLCVNDIRYGYAFQKQLGEQFRILAENTKWMWQNRYRDEYLRLSENKVIAAPGLPQDDTAFPLIQPTARLDQGMLDNFYLRLIRDGAQEGGAYAMSDGAPVFAAILSPEASDYIKKQNSDTRQDLRFSTQPNTLLAPLGVKFEYSGFFHLIDFEAPRYNWVGGQFVRVPYYANDPATYGTQSIVNPAYENAQYEVTFVFHPKVYTSRVPKPLTSPGGNTKFDPVNYRGDFQWVNFKSECNPLGNTGYFLGTFANGSEALRPEWGFSLMHRRCGPATNYLACS